MRWRETVGRGGRERETFIYDGRECTEIIVGNLLNYLSLLRCTKRYFSICGSNLTDDYYRFNFLWG